MSAHVFRRTQPERSARARQRLSEPSGIAQMEIWLATRSDGELASHVLPVCDQQSEKFLLLQGRLLARAGSVDPAFASNLMMLNIAALRGLAVEGAFGVRD